MPFAAALVLLTGACRKAEESATPTSKAEDRSITLTFWHIMNYTGPKEIIEKAVQRFEQAYPDTKIIIQTFDNDAYKTKLAIEMASGTPPDILFTWGGGALAEFAAADRVVDLTEALSENGWGDRFIDQALRICSSGSRVYAVPLDLSAVVLWYNRALFAKAGVQPPGTFNELLQRCKTFRRQGITPLALGNMKKWPGAFYFIYLANRCGGTQLFLDAAAGKPGASFADPSFVKAGDLLRRLIDARAFSTGFNGIDVGQARSQFLTGKAAMLLMGTWMVARAKSEHPEFLPNLDAMPFPVVEGGKGDSRTIVGGVNCGFAVSSACRHRERAIEFLRFLTAPEVAAEWCRIGRIPALKTSPEEEATLPTPTRKALVLLKKADTLQPYYDQYLSPRLAAEHINTTQKLFAKTMDSRQAAAAMAACARTTKAK